MDNAVRKEVDKLKGEEVVSATILERDKREYAKKLLDGNGEEMKNYLDNPPDPDIRLERKLKRSRKRTGVLSNLRKLVLGEKETEDY